MTDTSDLAQHPRKLLAGGAVKVRIAVASALVLSVGAWLAPRAAETRLTPSQERAAPLLEEQVQQERASATFTGVQDLAARVRAHSVAVVMPSQPSGSQNDYSETAGSNPVTGFGVYVSDTHVLTHSSALDGRSSVSLWAGGSSTRQAQVAAYEPQTGLVLLQTEPSGVKPVAVASQMPAAGALAVGVGRAEGREIALPVFVTSAGGEGYTIGAVNEEIMPGTPVFTLAGELFAIAAPDGRAVRAVPVHAATDRLFTRALARERRSSVGLGFQAPTASMAATFGEDGVVITDVIEGGPADLAGLAVGDVLLRVGEVEIDSIDVARQVLGSSAVGSPIAFRVRRASRVRDVEVTPVLAYEVAALSRARGDGPAGPEARVIFSPSVLERASIPPSARVVTVAGRAATSRAQTERQLRLARGPVPVLLQQGESRFFVILEPAP